MSYNRAETMVYTPGNHNTEEWKEMKQMFDNAYSDGIMEKLRWNGFDLNHDDADASSWRALRVHKCVKRNSMRKFLKAIGDHNDKTMMFCSMDIWITMRKRKKKSSKKGEWNTEHPLMKRMALEQSQDISLMFKKINKLAKLKEEATK